MKKSAAVRLKVINGAGCKVPLRKRDSRPKETAAGREELNRMLCDASQRGETERVKELLDRGTDADANNRHGWTALRYALWMTNKDMMELLIANGASVHTVDKRGKRALNWAVEQELADFVQLLKRHGAEG